MFQWLGQGRLELDRKSFHEAYKPQGLLSTQRKSSMVFGVKSFEHAFDRLEDRCVRVLDLVTHFDERVIQRADDWAAELYPRLKEFLHDAARENEQFRLVLDTHATLAFAAGTVLNIKSGRLVELEQRTLNRQIWCAGDSEPDPAWATWSLDVETLNPEGEGVAVAVSLTHNVTGPVRAFLAESLPNVRKLITASPSGGLGARCVASGQHAFNLADALTSRINQERAAGSPDTHLFIAGPNAFTFFMGQRQPSLGKVTLYEYDFEGNNGGSYAASLSLPL